jgi:hypothetical protein
VSDTKTAISCSRRTQERHGCLTRPKLSSGASYDARAWVTSDSTICGIRTPRSSYALVQTPRVVSERLGHSTIGITLDAYSHGLAGMREDAARRIDAALGAVVGGRASDTIASTAETDLKQSAYVESKAPETRALNRQDRYTTRV